MTFTEPAGTYFDVEGGKMLRHPPAMPVEIEMPREAFPPSANQSQGELRGLLGPLGRKNRTKVTGRSSRDG